MNNNNTFENIIKFLNNKQIDNNDVKNNFINVFDEMKIQYNYVEIDEINEECPIDDCHLFQNVGEHGLNIYITSTSDDNNIYIQGNILNKYIDNNLYYIIFKDDKLLFTNGNIFLEKSPWIKEYLQDLLRIKEKFLQFNNENANLLLNFDETITIDISFLID
jgi:hypothetical protein